MRGEDMEKVNHKVKLSNGVVLIIEDTSNQNDEISITADDCKFEACAGNEDIIVLGVHRKKTYESNT
jgi:FPC/CPF motif-containing protein YcgG